MKTLHAIIGIDYREPVGDEIYHDGDYYGIKVAYYGDGGLEDRSWYTTGDVVADFSAAIDAARERAEMISFSSTCDNFVMDSHGRYGWMLNDELGETGGFDALPTAK